MLGRRWAGATLLAAVAFLVGGTHASAQASKKGKAADKPDYKVTIHDDEHFRGKSVNIRGDVANLDAMKFSDHSESLKWELAPGRAAVLFDDKNFQKPVLVLVGKGGVEDLGKQQPNALHSVTSIGFIQLKKGARPKGLPRDVPILGEAE